MYVKKECVAMLLAGGEGKRLGSLTTKIAKPAVYFGGKYRIIDFPLSNCTNSGIDTVGVLTQYEHLVLHRHLGNGASWDLDRGKGGLTCLPPFVEKKGGSWYRGTADAIYQNICYIEQFNPDYVLILSGDHIYKMNYQAMIDYHKKQNAEATISVIEVPWNEASRFGIMNTNIDGSISEFEEKPPYPNSNLASMGVYIFNWSVLKSYLEVDALLEHSSHDFGKDIIPAMLADQRKLFAYSFKGYWKDVGTVNSYWEANMDLLDEAPTLQLHDGDWPIYSKNLNQPPHYLSQDAFVSNSLIHEGCIINGSITRSILFNNVEVQRNSFIEDSVLMPDVIIGKNVSLNKVIVKEGTFIPDGTKITSQGDDILVISKETPLQEMFYSHG
ncbi:glucose-1-phosphate adenylyltransferase [Halalkalibacter urbisdiaboli]|uniref:glucose-1-phosphate adenylyltransferase n=1 Tax=Halalkalibacter urbisdiaboli TaxID=1960589 RepID=UPI000B445927|nr:glucose-1-phosphate adenylyltransferase [Halalkalibacter urbisdiaboli]